MAVKLTEEIRMSCCITFTKMLFILKYKYWWQLIKYSVEDLFMMLCCIKCITLLWLLFLFSGLLWVIINIQKKCLIKRQDPWKSLCHVLNFIVLAIKMLAFQSKFSLIGWYMGYSKQFLSDQLLWLGLLNIKHKILKEKNMDSTCLVI